MRRPLLCLALVILAGLLLSGPARAGQEKDKAPAAAYKLAKGSFAVEVVRVLVLHDDARGKDLPVKIYYPKGDGPFPVLLFSHGYGGDKEAFTYLGNFLATHGYVSIHPSHGDVTPTKGGGRILGQLDKKISDPKAIAGRVADLVLVLDALAELPGKVPDLKGKLDLARIGVAGHSFGAYTAMLVGGVTVDLAGDKAKSFADKRVKAILPISAQGTGQQGLTAASWEGLRLPLLTVTGSKDLKPGQKASWRKEPFLYSPPGDKYLAYIEGASHFSFGGKVAASHVQDYVKIASVAFWDATLKDDRKAQDYLRQGTLEAFSRGAVKWSAK